MRIGVDCRSLQEPHPSGVSVYTQQVLRHIFKLEQARQHTFVLFLSGQHLKKQPGLLREIKARVHVDGPAPKIEWCVSYWPNKLFTGLVLTRVTRSIKKIFNDIDIVFVPNMQFFPLHDQSVPMALTMHDLSFERYPECLDFKGRWRHRLLKPRTFVGRSQAVIAVSEHTKQELCMLYGAVDEKIQVIYPGLSSLVEGGGQYQGEGKLELPEKFVLSLSAVEPRKNIQTLLQAIKLVRQDCPEVELVIAGGSAWKSKSIIQQIQDQPGVRYYGYVDECAKKQLLKQALLFAYPSLYEGFGFPPLEAQRAGTPVVVGAHSSLPEVLGNSALFADILDVNSVARAITALIQDDELRQKYIKLGYDNYQRFNWEITARQTLQVLTSIYGRY